MTSSGGQLRRQRRIEVGHVAERQIELVALQRHERLAEVASHAELDDQVRVLARNRPHRLRGRLDLAPDVDAQRVGRRLSHLSSGVVGDLEQLARDRQQALTGGREPDAAAFALEQTSEFALESGDPL
jgi:hypothetical protein